MAKNLIITHIADIDGMGSAILGKLVFREVEIVLANTDEVKEKLEEYFSKEAEYQEIFLCDLAFPKEMIALVENSSLKDKFHHFDHHRTSLETSMHSWSTVIVENNGILESGTSLFYKYLCSLKKYPILENKAVKEFVEAIRSYDTWDFERTKNYMGRYLTDIFSMIGTNQFIENYTNSLRQTKDAFTLSTLEQELVHIKEEEMKRYIDECDQNLIYTNFLDYRIGISIAEQFRSSLGNQLSLRHNDLDFILIVDFHRRSFSMRTTKEIDLSSIAKKLGGGGHQKAAGFPMNKENIEKIFPLLELSLSQGK